MEYFIENHVHFGWYPEIILTDRQKEILRQLINNTKEVTIQDTELVFKWPLIGYMLHELVHGVQVRIAVVGDEQWRANRRYQGILYPLDKMGDIYTPEANVRTAQELELADGNCIKTFLTGDADALRKFKPTILITDASGVVRVAIQGI